MSERFGDTLRRTRQNAEKTLGEVARLLEVSVVYVSDVERGNRRPFSNERILRVATFLNADAAPLIAAADVEKGVIEYDISRAKPLEAAVVGDLVSGLARGGVTDDQLDERIMNILKDSEEEVMTMPNRTFRCTRRSRLQLPETREDCYHCSRRAQLFPNRGDSTPCGCSMALTSRYVIGLDRISQIRGSVIELDDSEGFAKYDKGRRIIEILASPKTYEWLEMGYPRGGYFVAHELGTLLCCILTNLCA